MSRIKIGRQGDQAFIINESQKMVSAIHAYLDIDEETNQWWLEDNHSTNGTYIRNEKGQMERISREIIAEDTFIYLGSDAAQGCCFYAHQARELGQPTTDFLLIKRKMQELDNQIKVLDKTVKWKQMLIRLVVQAVLGFGVSLAFPNMGLALVVSIISGAIVDFFPFNRRKVQLLEERKHWRKCPNPSCCHSLSDEEIQNMQCLRCKAQ